MAPSQASQTAHLGMWTLLSAVQLVQRTGRLKWWPSRFWYLNLAKNSIPWLHQRPLQCVHPLQILKMHKGCGNGR